MKIILYSTIFLVFVFSNLKAQLSPGDLHKTHAFLEGIENCTQCHTPGKKETRDNCLNCHTILRNQIEKNAGLHANSEYRDCIKCHVDHLGRDYELIYWGKEGKKSFDHGKTGYELQGTHKQLSCEKCHNATKISSPERLRQRGKDLNKTFLGLNRECSNCHFDEHRGQMDINCLNCHNMTGWNEVSGFDHNATDFRLTGKHQNVQCSQCHKIIQDDSYPDDATYLNFTLQNFNTCQSCHKDIHANRFGSNCKKCHNTSGWENYNKNSFDHSKTRYPLTGKHALLSCEQCHLPGKSMKINEYQKCMDCHKDEHKGQFVNRIQKGACEECHTVEGFSPSRFTLEMHQECSYPLEGSHLAVSCLDCHKKQTSATHKEFIPFRFESTQCVTCHQDVHAGETSNISETAGCQHCHSINSWQDVSFDHNNTNFRLQGRHASASCGQCHKDESHKWHFRGLNMACSECHSDVHQGQFSTLGQKMDCSRCHSPIDWFADRFDHEKDSNFKLQGAHMFVSCETCHKSERRDNILLTIYKPLDKKCESCHKE